ncbi:AraC family transcriptional regulator [Paenibacillus methanolicus]|uniref:AraC family L-rhamnose operon regulatory protein RhaS n=1 Tax=Paenibacillus methanolicus TaxID=582686 RepID=A0A5S5CHZ6_9BACL|nr:AraC family transcriptional regulator [Paenibacillus methanolicus]TYP79154.1 AraC family L-rhamnose operon regulatory protein RhaS [Paenibacillus methanolicus]
MTFVTEAHAFYPEYRHMTAVRDDNPFEAGTVYAQTYRLVLVSGGSGLMRMNGKLYPLLAPSIICLNEQDEALLVSGGEPRTLTVYFHPAAINKQFQLGMPESPDMSLTDFQDLWCLDPFRDRTEAGAAPCRIGMDVDTARFAGKLIEEMRVNLIRQPDAQWPCRSRSLLMELLFLVRRLLASGGEQPDAALPEEATGLAPMLAYLHAHYRAKVKLEELAQRFHTNRTTLNERFKASTGRSVMAYLNDIRMQNAGMMLRNTRLPVEEIMFAVGMRDHAHFARTFRKHAGYSPSEYRSRFCTM